MTFNVDAPALGNAISADIPDIEENFAVFGPYETIWLPAHGGLDKASTAGAEQLNGTNQDWLTLEFDHTTEEYTIFVHVMPENWNRGTVKAKFYWVPSAGCSAGDVVQWGIQGASVSNDAAWDVAWGSAVTVTDTVTAGVEADLHISAATAAITIGATPALNDIISFRVYRDADDATDTMDAEDAELIGVLIQYTISEEAAAW